jgi:hypothetical protein
MPKAVVGEPGSRPGRPGEYPRVHAAGDPVTSSMPVNATLEISFRRFDETSRTPSTSPIRAA